MLDDCIRQERPTQAVTFDSAPAEHHLFTVGVCFVVFTPANVESKGTQRCFAAFAVPITSPLLVLVHLKESTMPASNYLRGKVTDHVLRNIAYAPPPVVYVSLHTSDPTVNATAGTEISASWYARQSVSYAAQVTAGQTSNNATITYPGVQTSAVTVTHFAIWDSATLGNMLEFAPLSAAKTFSVTDVPSWLPGQLASTMT